MKCPVCGHKMVRKAKYVWRKVRGKLVNVTVYYYRCYECGHTQWEV